MASVKTVLLFRSKFDEAAHEDIYEKVKIELEKHVSIRSHVDFSFFMIRASG